MATRAHVRRRRAAKGLRLALTLACTFAADVSAGAPAASPPLLARVQAQDAPASILLPLGWVSTVHASAAQSRSPAIGRNARSVLEISVAPVGAPLADDERGNEPRAGYREAAHRPRHSRAREEPSGDGILCVEEGGPEHVTVGACAAWKGSLLLVAKLTSPRYDALGGLSLVKRVLVSAEGFRGPRPEEGLVGESTLGSSSTFR